MLVGVALAVQANNRKYPHIIAVDFDGTLSLDAVYPNIGRPNIPLFTKLKTAKNNGCKIILWTCREYDSYLPQAIDFCKDNGLIFDAVNDNIPEIGFNPRKIVADLYIDDHSVNTYDLDY